MVLCSVTSVAASLAEVRRVLKPGGRYLFSEHTRAPDGWNLLDGFITILSIAEVLSQLYFAAGDVPKVAFLRVLRLLRILRILRLMKSWKGLYKIVTSLQKAIPQASDLPRPLISPTFAHRRPPSPAFAHFRPPSPIFARLRSPSLACGMAFCREVTIL